jgi:hypothetical protein
VKPGDAAAATAAAQATVAPWTAIADIGSRFMGATPAQLNTAFDRTYGAVGDALGFAPARELHAAWQDMLSASIAQQDARANYALLVQHAFADGFQRLLVRLADKANAGERIDSVLALLRLWAVCAEEAVHETLQSERGLAATAALTRTGLGYRKTMQHAAAVIGELVRRRHAPRPRRSLSRDPCAQARAARNAPHTSLRRCEASAAQLAPALGGRCARKRKMKNVAEQAMLVSRAATALAITPASVRRSSTPRAKSFRVESGS